MHRKTAAVFCRQKRKWDTQRFKKMAVKILLVLLIATFLLGTLGTIAHATGLVDDTVSSANEYSKYPFDHYQLDFYVDTGWDWLPWNWLDGIGKQVMYGLYAITNFIWTISLYLSNATGYLIQEAYSLDFISSTADSIGKNMQTLAGVTRSGLSSDGFYSGFLLILILVVGIYVAYTGLIKRETTKAIHAVVNFIVVFLLSAAFIAYAPDYIGKINDFSADISHASLSLGTKIVMPDSNSKGKDSVDLIRDSLFAIQVKQPWLLLQYGNSDIETIGVDRVEELLATSPDENNGKDREELVKEEIEDRENTYLTVTKTINRLGTVFFLFLFNIGISVFVFLLTGTLIFSQVLFILYALFLPISFLLSMIPSFDGMSKRAITKLFNTILTRAGITLIITIAFSISSMLYTLSNGYPFFLIAFLQVVTFAGIYFKLGDLMSLFSLQSSDSQSMGSRIMRKPRMLMNAHMHHLQHKLGRSVKALEADGTAKKSGGSMTFRTSQADHTRPDSQDIEGRKDSLRNQTAAATGTVSVVKDQARTKSIPPQKNVPEGVQDFHSGVVDTTITRAEGRKENEQHRKTMGERRSVLKPVMQKGEVASGKKTTAALIHERPNTIIPVSKSDGIKSQSLQNIKLAERSSAPAIKERATTKEDLSPVRAERQTVPASSPVKQSDSQSSHVASKKRPTISPMFSSVPKSTSSIRRDRKTQHPAIQKPMDPVPNESNRKRPYKNPMVFTQEKRGEKR